MDFLFLLRAGYIVKKERRPDINPFALNSLYVHKSVSLSSHDQRNQEKSYLQNIGEKNRIDVLYFGFLVVFSITRLLCGILTIELSTHFPEMFPLFSTHSIQT